MKPSISAVLLCLLSCFAGVPESLAQTAAPASAEPAVQRSAPSAAPAVQRSPAEQSKAEMRSLDEQVQDVKSDVLSIAADLSRLEEKLLYPSNTEIAVFVSIAEGQTFRLDSMQISIDGQLATHYIYSFKELDALQKGGVQRIYTGNVPTGSHSIAVSVAGVTDGGKDFSSAQSFAFDKGVEPKLLGITLTGPERIELGEW
ncbi:MAG TPA: hypothetical protein VFV10_10520 [Gammaproteobacteria bacterium]|nr:hypothetical protein [Gammaproteobacteria bacterium]